MDKDERDALIKEKQAEIDRLKAEIGSLKGVYVATLTKNKIINAVGYRDGEVYVSRNRTGWSDAWTDIKNLSLKIFFEKDNQRHLSTWGEFYHSRKLLQRDMTHEQRQMAAQFCDDVISLYNTYVLNANTFVLNGKPCSLKEPEEDDG